MGRRGRRGRLRCVCTGIFTPLKHRKGVRMTSKLRLKSWRSTFPLSPLQISLAHSEKKSSNENSTVACIASPRLRTSAPRLRTSAPRLHRVHTRVDARLHIWELHKSGLFPTFTSETSNIQHTHLRGSENTNVQILSLPVWVVGVVGRRS